MSIDLIVEVLLHAPPSLTPAEKLLLTVIAESCNPKTRMTWYRSGWGAEEVARRTHLTTGSLSKTFWSLAQKGCEVRVAHGIDKKGRPVFAHKGKQTTFRLPHFAPQRSDEDRTIEPTTDGKGPTYVGVRSDEDRGFEAQRSDEDRTLLLKDLPSKNTSSLSPREDDAATPIVPAQRTEREIEDASQNNQTDNPIHRLLLDAGCPSERLTEAERWITDECQPRGLGWWRKTGGNGDLKVHVAAFLEAGPSAQVCPDCDDTGETGDWMNRRACSCIWWKDPGAARGAFIEQLKNFPNCEHGIAGGNMTAPNGWQHCPKCRGAGWVDPDVQTASDGFRAVFNRSPADRAVRDAQPLYDKYKRQEEHNGAYLGPAGYHHLKDSRHPGRDYSEPL